MFSNVCFCFQINALNKEHFKLNNFTITIQVTKRFYKVQLFKLLVTEVKYFCINSHKKSRGNKYSVKWNLRLFSVLFFPLRSFSSVDIVRPDHEFVYNMRTKEETSSGWKTSLQLMEWLKSCPFEKVFFFPEYVFKCSFNCSHTINLISSLTNLSGL